MSSVYTGAVIAVSFCYFLAAILYQGTFWGHKEFVRRARQFLWAGMGIHAVALIVRAVMDRALPFTGRVEALSFFSFCLVTVFLLLSLRYRLEAAGAFFAPFAFLASVCVYVNSRTIPPPGHLESKWIAVHVPIILLSFATCALATVGAVTYTTGTTAVIAFDPFGSATSAEIRLYAATNNSDKYEVTVSSASGRVKILTTW